MTPEQRARRLRLARLRNDALAIATLEADRDYRPVADTTVNKLWCGLRWSGVVVARERVWHA